MRDRLVAGARLSRSGVLVLVVEAGIGKTALLDYLQTAADGMQVIRITGTEAERDLPFGALAQALEPAMQYLDLLPQPQAEAEFKGACQRLRP